MEKKVFLINPFDPVFSAENSLPTKRMGMFVKETTLTFVKRTSHKILFPLFWRSNCGFSNIVFGDWAL